MSDVAIAALQRELAQFARERGWEQYHTPRNLAALISSEAGELLALFRWDQDALADSPSRVREELADVFLGVLRFASVAGIDIVAAGHSKIAANAAKYPVGETQGPDQPGGERMSGPGFRIETRIG